MNSQSELIPCGNLTDLELDETAYDLFLKILPAYMTFHKSKKYDTGIQINMFDDIFLQLRWGKCYRKRFIKTDVLHRRDYQVNEEDLKLLTKLSDFFRVNTIDALTKWYDAQALKKGVPLITKEINRFANSRRELIPEGNS